jgi:hypothetical protein
MATPKQILLGVWRDKNAPFNPSTGKRGYYLSGTDTPASVGRSFDTNSIKGIMNISEGGVTYGQFIYQLNDNSVPETVTVIQASGSIITLTNA